MGANNTLGNFRWVDGYGMFSTDPNGIVHWLAKPDGTPAVDSFYNNVEGEIGMAFANCARKIRED